LVRVAEQSEASANFKKQTQPTLVEDL